MFMTVVEYLIFFTLIPYGYSIFRVCIPNTQFQWNGRICFCDNTGRWFEGHCHPIERQEPCKPGQVIARNCSQCICNEIGQLICTNVPCNAHTVSRKPTLNYLENAGPWCIPFRSYYINCSLCACPASGKTWEANCVTDNSCILKESTSDFVSSSLKNVCIPKVMYIFPCLQCLCSDNGHFVINECIETCQKDRGIENRRCIPKTFYKKECNICWCPENGMKNETLCSKNKCINSLKYQSLLLLENRVSKCKSYTFTKPVCFYCNCNTEGKIDLNACFENECFNIPDLKYNFAKPSCSSGEMLAVCMECFCLRNGLTNNKYCTRTCTMQSKLSIVEKVLIDNRSKNDFINPNSIKRATVDNHCSPDLLYIDRGRYCLCPKNGSTHFKICTSNVIESDYDDNSRYVVSIDFNSTCEAGIFIDFDCNTCYCMKNGKFDSKWCTYDDCHAKKIIQENYKTNQAVVKALKAVRTCIPGTMSKVHCNFCICPDSGLLKERACTKNDCTEIRGPIRNDKLTCEPSTYYSVDCNICYCPRDGLKNIVKCTKNQCEKMFLRSDTCTPGDLFSDNCNVCVCPPNGDKLDKACTNHTCLDADTPWQKIFKISQNLLENKAVDETTRNLELCFPGEEFVVGCKVCVCPDMGLREYASCTPMLCNEGSSMPETDDYETLDVNATIGKEPLSASRRKGKGCITYNLTDSSERKECTPGSMYIIRCRQCICPYMGNINHFCRPLPKGFYCEQAYPNFNYLPMGRRDDQETVAVNTTLSPSLTKTPRRPITVMIKHNHTKYKCLKPGKMVDDCYICDCEDNQVIEEHCFKSDDVKCANVLPSFLTADNKIFS